MKILANRPFTHAALSALGVPRKKDGNRLGLQKRKQLLLKAVLFPPDVPWDVNGLFDRGYEP